MSSINSPPPRQRPWPSGCSKGGEIGSGSDIQSNSIGSDASRLASPNRFTLDALRAEATTIVGRLALQGRVLRVHFDEGAPPVCCATIVVGHALSIWEDPNGNP